MFFDECNGHFKVSHFLRYVQIMADGAASSTVSACVAAATAAAAASAENAANAATLWIYDFDGVLCDSARETSMVAIKCCKQLFGDEFTPKEEEVVTAGYLKVCVAFVISLSHSLLLLLLLLLLRMS